jgi:CubicO group peptidase (beta-lactamase class C family)
MQKWLEPGLDYISRWLEFQMTMSEQPGCVIAIAQKNRIVLERAFGYADLSKGLPLTPRHRFRIASHSKTFTAAGVLKLREQRKLKLDEEVGTYLATNLHPRIARTTVGQLLSHSAGIVRDGEDSGQATVLRRGRAQGRPAGASGYRAQYTLQVFQSRIRPDRVSDRGCHGRSVHALDQARNHRCGGAHRELS